MQVQNTSKEIQALAGQPAWQPGEIREVTEEAGEYLLANPYFAEVKKPAKEKQGSITEAKADFVDRNQGETFQK